MEPSDQTIFFKIFKNYNYNVINKLPLPPVSSVYNGHLDGGGEALNHVRFRTVMHPTWCMGWGWMEDMIEHVKADD